MSNGNFWSFQQVPVFILQGSFSNCCFQDMCSPGGTLLHKLYKLQTSKLQKEVTKKVPVSFKKSWARTLHAPLETSFACQVPTWKGTAACVCVCVLPLRALVVFFAWVKRNGLANDEGSTVKESCPKTPDWFKRRSYVASEARKARQRTSWKEVFAQQRSMQMCHVYLGDHWDFMGLQEILTLRCRNEWVFYIEFP